MSNASGKQRRKSAGKRVVKTFDNTPDDEFERDAAEIYARQVENYEQAKAGGVELKKPSIDAIREALSLHAVPRVKMGSQQAEEPRRNFLEARYAMRGLLEGIMRGSGRIYALDSFVTLLDEFCAELQKLAERPPRGASEAVKKVLAGRVRLPLNIGSKDVEIERIKRLLKRYGVGLPHRLKEGGNSELQMFAADLINKTKALRGQIELHGPSNEDKFQQQLARLPLMPDKCWRTLLRKAPDYFYGSNWLETEEHCARWAEPWIKFPKKKITEHRAKRVRNSLVGKGRREAALRERAKNELSKCVDGWLKGGFAWWVV